MDAQEIDNNDDQMRLFTEELRYEYIAGLYDTRLSNKSTDIWPEDLENV